ncbi:TcaA 3rd/4th domain-containing protein [Bavariicoccus seileri]
MDRYGENYYSYENQVSRLKDTVASKSAEKIVNNMISEDEQFEVTEKSLKPFVDYLKTDSDYLANTIDQMEFGAMGNNDVYVTQSGKHLLFYDKYVLAIKPTYFAVHTNLTGMLLSVNGEDQDTSNSDDFTWKVGPVSPGQYSFKGTFDDTTFDDTNGEESTIEDTVIQIYQQELNENDERLVSLEATKVKFDLVADIPNGEIFVDGKSVGQLKDGRLDGINYIWHDGSTLTIKQKIGDLELESQNIEIDPYSYSDSSYGAFSELSVSVIPVAIYSNMVGADIKIDGKKVATVGEDSEVKFNLVMPEEDHELVAVQSFEDGEITSQKEKISPVSFSYYYDLSSESRKDAFDFSTWLNDLYFSISDFADDDYDFGEDEINALADYFVGGKDNKEFIDFKDAFIGETRENDKIRYIQTSLGEVEKVTAVGAKDYEVQYTVNYYTIYTDSTASVDETFRYKKATFSVEDGELKIKDLGGKDNFEKVE